MSAPGRRASRQLSPSRTVTPLFPSRDEFIAHVERHAEEDGIELRLGIRVERIDRHGGRYTLTTSGGELDAAQVVVAAGYEQEPVIPKWPGRSVFGGERGGWCEQGLAVGTNAPTSSFGKDQVGCRGMCSECCSFDYLRASETQSPALDDAWISAI